MEGFVVPTEMRASLQHAKFGKLYLLLLIASLHVQVGEPLALPGCPKDCGNGVLIPYPFGVGVRCYLSSYYEVFCKDNKPFIVQYSEKNAVYEVTEILLQTSEIRVLSEFRQRSSVSEISDPDFFQVYLTRATFSFSHTKNKLTTVGCNAIGALILYDSKPSGDGIENGNALGCLVTCRSGTDNGLADDTCGGYGCCQTSIPPAVGYISLTYQAITQSNLPWLAKTPADGTQSGYVFVVEAANYTFKKNHIGWQGNKTFPLVLNWLIRGTTCENAQTNSSSYACKDINSICINSTIFTGYTCNCSQGYQGNPYLDGGCQGNYIH